MTGLGTIINTAAIAAGGLLGHPGVRVRGARHAPGPAGRPGDDGPRGGLSLPGRLRADLLRGVNLVWGKRLRVANMLPGVVLAVIAVYLPWGF